MKYLCVFLALVCAFNLHSRATLQKAPDPLEENVSLALEMVMGKKKHEDEDILQAVQGLPMDLLGEPREVIKGMINARDEAEYALYESLARLGIARERFNPGEDFGFGALFRELVVHDFHYHGLTLDPFYELLLAVMPEEYAVEIMGSVAADGEEARQHLLQLADSSAHSEGAEYLSGGLRHRRVPEDDFFAAVDDEEGDPPVPGCEASYMGLLYLADDATNGWLGDVLGWKRKRD